MEQFIYGLLVGVAIGMWGAILLYRYSGKAQPGWPFRRGTCEDQTASTDADRPDDDFDEDYYAEQERARTQGVPVAQTSAPAGAHGSVVYTDTRAGAPPWPPKTQAELDDEFDAVVADWPDDWDEMRSRSCRRLPLWRMRRKTRGSMTMPA